MDRWEKEEKTEGLEGRKAVRRRLKWKKYLVGELWDGAIKKEETEERLKEQ